MNLTPGIIIAAPSSGAGKTVFTLALLRAISKRGLKVCSAKVGPDYIDPAYHSVACGKPCYNLDGWAMRDQTIAGVMKIIEQNAELVITEGVMGLFDGAFVGSGSENDGSTAALAALTGWPIILVVDAQAQAQSVAALVGGFANHDVNVNLAGVVFNRVGSPRHEAILKQAMNDHLPQIPVLGCLPKSDGLLLPERHLGLVQAREHDDLDVFLNRAAELMDEHIDVDRLLSIAKPANQVKNLDVPLTPIPALGQHIAIAQDDAFAFLYPSTLAGWRNIGCEISFFSPLANEAPAEFADAVYLPGGYPELFAGKLADNAEFLGGLKNHQQKNTIILGECGGYMVLGDGLTDQSGCRHKMAGLLPLETSFADKKLHLGYRRVKLLDKNVLGLKGTVYRGHEFHYSSVSKEVGADVLFDVETADGRDLNEAGLKTGSVMGSFIHLIDRENE